MATLLPSGFSPAHARSTTNFYYVPASDTNTYAHGDTVATIGSVFAGRLPDASATQGMLHVTRAVSGGRLRGVVVGIMGGLDLDDEAFVPSAKTRPYVLLVNDSPLTVYKIQGDNTSQLVVASGMYANYTTGAVNGSVSGTRLSASSLNSSSGDVLVQSVLSNTSSNSTFAVTFTSHEEFSGGNGSGDGLTPYEANISGAVSIDLALIATVNLHLTLVGNVSSFELLNPVPGKVYGFRFYQDATGSRTFAPFTAATYKFPGGTAPTFSTASSAWDFMSAQWGGANKTTYACSFLRGMA